MRRAINWFDEKAVAAYYRELRRKRIKRVLHEIITELIAAIGIILLFIVACTIFLIEIGG